MQRNVITVRDITITITAAAVPGAAGADPEPAGATFALPS